MNEEKKLLVTYSVFDPKYNNGSLRFFRGLQDANAVSTPKTVGTIDYPYSAGFPILPSDVDIKMFSFVYKGEVRFLAAKIVSPVSGVSPFTAWSLMAAPTPPYGSWAVLARDVELQWPAKNPATVITNPQGIAQVGENLFAVDYDTRKIYRLGANELNGLPVGAEHPLVHEPFDIGAAAGLDPKDKGQSIIAIKDSNGNDKLFVLFINFDDTTFDHGSGVLVRLGVSNTGGITYEAQVNVGKNPQEIIPVADANDSNKVHLLIPAIGGKQQGGSTNEAESNIMDIPAFGDWTSGPAVLLTGDETPSSTYDIRAIAAGLRAGSNGIVYLLTGIFNTDTYSGFTYKLYQTTVSQLLAANWTPLSDAVGTILTEVESGTVISPTSPFFSTIYFWDVLYEVGDSAEGDNDRLWFFRGTELIVTDVAAYGSPYYVKPNPGPYMQFAVGEARSDIGGYNVDAADLTIETVRQAEAGVSLKRGVMPVTAAEVEVDADK